MLRILEPELMSEQEQVHAYAQADFSEPHELFIKTLCAHIKLKKDFSGTTLDLGCGPCDVTMRFAKRFLDSPITAVDGSMAMLDEAHQSINNNKLTDRIQIVHSVLPDATLDKQYDLIMSNSLLHHLHQPEVLWSTIKQCSVSGSQVFIMDLLRPESEHYATTLVQRYAANEPSILQRDFFNSLRAAFNVSEVRQQLDRVGLNQLHIEQVSDRHFCVYGTTR